MEAHAFELDGVEFTESNLEAALAAWRRGTVACWVDLKRPDRDELEALLDDLGVSGLLRRRCLEAGDNTAVISLSTGTFIELPVFADRDCTKTTHLVALLLPNLLVTIHAGAIERADDFREAIEFLQMEQLSASSVLCALLFEQSAVVARAARDLRKKLIDDGRRMDEDIESVQEKELEELKRRVLLTDAIAEEQQEAVALLHHARGAGFESDGLKGPISLITTTAGLTDRLIDRLDGRVDNLLRRQQDYKQGLLNRRLGMLTVLSAIFLPLTLLAGIWGMNFEYMPGLDEPWAYPAAIGAMTAMGASGILFFWKRGWLK